MSERTRRARPAAWSPVHVQGRVDDATHRPAAVATPSGIPDLHRALFAHMVEGVAYCRMLFDEAGQPSDYINVEVNPAFEELTGLRESVGRPITEVIPGIREANPELFEIYGRVTRTGTTEQFETYVPGLERWFSITAFRPQPDHFAAVFSNITERKGAEQTLRDREVFLNETEELSKVGGWAYDPASRTVSWTDEMYRIYEVAHDYDPSDLQATIDLVAPESRALMGEAFRLAVEEGRPYDLELRVVTATGREIWVRTNASAQLEAGRVLRVHGHVQDITDRRRAGEALRASEALLRGAIDAMLDPFLVCSSIRGPDGAITGFRAIFANRAAERFMGRKPDTLTGAPVPDRMAYLGGMPFFETFRQVVETDAGWAAEGVEFMVPGGDGSLISGQIDIQVAKFDDGFFAVWRDVTERRAFAEALRQSEERFRQFFERTPDYVTMVSTDRRLVDANPAALAALGYAHEELVGLPIETIYAPESRGRIADLFERWTETGPLTNLEQTLMTRAGERRTVLLSASMVRDGTGRPLYYLGVQRDITELREAQANAELEGRIRAALGGSLLAIAAGAGAAEAAQAICDQLVTLPSVDLVAIEAFLGTADVEIIALRAPPGYTVPVGTRLPPIRASLVRERAAVGPWAEYVSADLADGWVPGAVADGLKALAYGPIGHGSHVLGALLIGTFDEAFAATLVEKMPHVVSSSATSSLLLAERLGALRREADLRAAIVAVLAAGAFHPVFQPIVDLETGEVVGYEALTRFDSGQRPDLCFADAWSVGLGPELELATLASAVEAGRRLAPGVWLDLNMSPRLLADPERLGPILWGAGRPLVLEITEHEVIEDYDVVREAVRSLGRDIRLAVDDAGAGVANFGHIIDLRPDFVKLDISLVRRVNANLGRQAMVVGMRHFSRTAGCRLIAEGVETIEEARTLTALGVEFGQGYLFGYPEPVAMWTATSISAAAREPSP